MSPLAQIQKEVDSLMDATGESIDVGIKRAVVALRYRGFNTTASCEGHLDHGFAYPWIDLQYDDRKLRKHEKKRLKRLLKDFYKTTVSAHPLLIQDFADFRLQSVKWPRSAKKRKAQDERTDGGLLMAYRHEMDSFADFLIKTKEV